jgi:mannose-1-phosphate guanylyltransferase
MPAIEHFWAVVPAGGTGTRLWPLSRSGRPKFLLDLTGQGRSMLQETVDRLAPLDDGRLLVVTGTAHREQVLAQLPEVPPDRILGEPSRRESMGAIGLAAALLERRDPEAVMGSFAADHAIRDTDELERAVRLAVDVAREGWLVTIGIEATAPSTAYGYIRQGSPLEGHEGAYVAEKFVEKPSAEVAQSYLAEGGFRWNASMFVVRPGVLLDLLAAERPAFAADLREIAASPDRFDEIWARLPRIAIDHAVAEPAAAAGRVAVVPADLGWNDVGDFDSLLSVLGGDALSVLGDPDQVLAGDTSGLVVPGSGRVVAVLGLDDIVVVDTSDAVLVTTRARAQEVKGLVDRLTEAGLEDLV